MRRGDMRRDNTIYRRICWIQNDHMRHITAFSIKVGQNFLVDSHPRSDRERSRHRVTLLSCQTISRRSSHIRLSLVHHCIRVEFARVVMQLGPTVVNGVDMTWLVS